MAGRAYAGEIGVLAHNVPVWQIFMAFARISVTGWGGGTGTIYTMHHELVRRGWITSGQFGLDFGLSRIVPGINLSALAVIIGYRLNGIWGSVAATLGFHLPFSLITMVLTIGFVGVTTNPFGDSAVKGAVAVTAGLTFALALETAQSWLPWRERVPAVLMAICIVVSFVLVAFAQVNVAIVIVGSAIIGALLFRPSETAAAEDAL
jgi:chromate transporter